MHLATFWELHWHACTDDHDDGDAQITVTITCMLARCHNLSWCVQEQRVASKLVCPEPLCTNAAALSAAGLSAAGLSAAGLSAADTPLLLGC